jgi:hypothetical protein
MRIGERKGRVGHMVDKVVEALVKEKVWETCEYLSFVFENAW